ncbi:MAG: MFS transporter [Candidatus Hodarchaeales archaeon]|jgi:MFS family permease
MMSKLHSFLYIDDMLDNARKFALKYFKVNFSVSFTFALFETFLVLYVLQFVSFIELGIILSIRFAIQALMDYPTGALADVLGHKRVLTVAYIGHIISILIFLSSKSFNGILVAYLISAVAISQESGALISWFDNKYNSTSETFDIEKKTYGAFMGRVQTINILTLSISFVLGGFIAEIYSREILFVLHLIFLIFTLGLILRLLDNENNTEVKLTSQVYFSQLKGGFSFLKNRPGLILLFIGIAISSASAWAIWGSLMLFPTYEAYSGSDQVTGLLRSSIFLIGVFWSILAATLSKRITKVYRMALIMNIVGGPLFFYSMYLYQTHNPPTGSFDLYSIIGLVIIFQLVGIPMALGDIVFRRIMIDLIPNNLRNTIYSMIPSMITLVGIPFSLIGGWMIVNNGFTYGIWVVATFSLVGTFVMAMGFYVLSHDNAGVLTIEKQYGPNPVV